MLLTSSDTKRTLMHLFLFTNSAQRELVSICAQSIRNRNKLSLHCPILFRKRQYLHYRSMKLKGISALSKHEIERNICTIEAWNWQEYLHYRSMKLTGISILSKYEIDRNICTIEAWNWQEYLNYRSMKLTGIIWNLNILTVFWFELNMHVHILSLTSTSKINLITVHI